MAIQASMVKLNGYSETLLDWSEKSADKKCSFVQQELHTRIYLAGAVALAQLEALWLVVQATYYSGRIATAQVLDVVGFTKGAKSDASHFGYQLSYAAIARAGQLVSATSLLAIDGMIDPTVISRREKYHHIQAAPSPKPRRPLWVTLVALSVWIAWELIEKNGYERSWQWLKGQMGLLETVAGSKMREAFGVSSRQNSFFGDRYQLQMDFASMNRCITKKSEKGVIESLCATKTADVWSAVKVSNRRSLYWADLEIPYEVSSKCSLNHVLDSEGDAPSISVVPAAVDCSGDGRTGYLDRVLSAWKDACSSENCHVDDSGWERWKVLSSGSFKDVFVDWTQ